MNINRHEKSTEIETHNEIDLLDIFAELWNKKFSITAITSIAAVLSVLYALHLPNIFVSSALLAPADESKSSSGMLGQFSGVANLAGISLGGDSSDKSVEAIERIRSFDFFSNHFLPEISVQNLTALESWDASTNTLSYEEDIYNITNDKWLSSAPSNQQAYKVYTDIMNISQDKKTLFITLSVKHKSPHIAKEWTEIIIRKINSSMRNQDKIQATKSLDFLNNQANKVNFQEIRQAISSLQENQMKSLMLIEANDDYIFKVIDSPIAPEIKSEPKRSLIAIVGTVLGFVIAIFGTIILNLYRKK